MAIRPSLWLVFMILTGIACGDRVSFELQQRNKTKDQKYYDKLIMTHGNKSRKPLEYGSENSSYNCFLHDFSVSIKIMLRHEKAKVSDVYVAKNSGSFRKLEGDQWFEEMDHVIY